MAAQTPVYVISVAARLLDVHPQTLRNYERAGFLRPTRTEGRRRLYSAEDIEQLRLLIGTVEQFGLNLTGLKMLLVLREELEGLHATLGASLADAEAAVAREQVARLLLILSGDTSHLSTEAEPTETTER
jgi:MerR family transcriptional regulator/heat shock protein HspR